MINDRAKGEIAQLVKDNRSFLICGHVRPDADCIGSQLALYIALKRLGRRAEVWVEDEVPHTCLFLPASGEIRHSKPIEGKFDVTFVLDTPNPERLGRFAGHVSKMPVMVNIDHHPSNIRWGRYNWVDPRASATTELIYILLKEMGVEIDLELATCIYTGIITDTGRFCYSNTTVFTHRLAGEMLQCGVSPAKVSDRLYAQNRPVKIKLLGQVLSSLRIDDGGSLAWVWIRREMYDKTGAKSQDAEGFINYARDMEGVKVAVLLEEQTEGNHVRVSLRSRDSRIDVNKIAERFGGGGHAAAAGALIEGTDREVEDKLLDDIRRTIAREGVSVRISGRKKAGRNDVS